MSRPVQVLVAAAAAIVILIGGLWLLSAVHQAQSPEAKCQQVMADIERERAPQVISPDAWQAGYEACLAQERK